MGGGGEGVNWLRDRPWDLEKFVSEEERDREKQRRRRNKRGFQAELLTLFKETYIS